MINLKDVYILNPSYRLRQDGNRVVLASFDDRTENAPDDWISFIHPLHAQILSFFSSPAPLKDIIDRCASFLRLDKDTTFSLLTKFINNKEFGIKIKNIGNAYFPKEIIQKWDYKTSPVIYAPEDFIVKGDPDLHTYRLHFPISINMELTMNCYVNCEYCYANRKLKNTYLLSKDEIISFIRTAKSQGILSIDINGGEVLLHPNIKEILKELSDNGYIPLISTKMPVPVDMLIFLKNTGINLFQISLDSVDKCILAQMISPPKSYFTKIENTLHEASTLGLKVNINTVITKHNSYIENIDKLCDFLSRYSAVQKLTINPAGFSLYKSNYADFAPSLGAIRLLENHANKIMGKYPFSVNFAGYEEKEIYTPSNKIKAFENRAICTGNLRSMVILPNGDVTICEELYDHPAFIIGNITESSIEDIWNSPKARALYEFSTKNSNSACHDCQQMLNCRRKKGVCWKTVLMAYGNENWEYPDPRCPRAPQPYRAFYSE